MTVMATEIEATVCLALYIHKLKVCACASFVQETKASIDGIQLPKHIDLMPIYTLHGTQGLRSGLTDQV